MKKIPESRRENDEAHERRPVGFVLGNGIGLTTLVSSRGLLFLADHLTSMLYVVAPLLLMVVFKGVVVTDLY
jgi:hypothetical protein